MKHIVTLLVASCILSCSSESHSPERNQTEFVHIEYEYEYKVLAGDALVVVVPNKEVTHIVMRSALSKFRTTWCKVLTFQFPPRSSIKPQRCSVSAVPMLSIHKVSAVCLLPLLHHCKRDSTDRGLFSACVPAFAHATHSPSRKRQEKLCLFLKVCSMHPKNRPFLIPTTTARLQRNHLSPSLVLHLLCCFCLKTATVDS